MAFGAQDITGREIFPTDSTDTTVCGAQDTLGLIRPADLLQQIDTVTVSAGDIFGELSYIPLNADHHGGTASGFIYDTPYQLIIIALLVMYGLLLFRHGGELWSMIRSVWSENKDRNHRPETDTPSLGFRVSLAACGLTGLGVGVVRLTGLWADEAFVTSLPYRGAWAAIAIIAVAFLLIFFIQNIILRAAGSLTFTTGFTEILIARRRAFFASATVTGTPAILLLALSYGWYAYMFAVVFALIVSLHIILYIVRSFFLFVEQKVSILLWFLYLCAVELMPAGIFIAGMLRSISN